jgi:hypothetical protein
MDEIFEAYRKELTRDRIEIEKGDILIIFTPKKWKSKFYELLEENK